MEGILPVGLQDGGELLRDDLSTHPLNMALNSGLLQFMQKPIVVCVNRVYVCVSVCVRERERGRGGERNEKRQPEHVALLKQMDQNLESVCKTI